MPRLSPSSSPQTGALRFATALSTQSDTKHAAGELVDDIQATFGTAPIDLACLFFSAHHAVRADVLVGTISRALRPRFLIGCSGEGIMADAEELDTAPAVTLWAASLPDVTLDPIRASFSPTQDQFRLSDWPDFNGEDASLLVVADPFTTPVQEVLSLLDDRYPGVKAIGGLAGGGHGVGEN
ncbi:MAG: FIST N-terminal domain-containing protein, partial [Nitrospiraceae bacterium]